MNINLGFANLKRIFPLGHQSLPEILTLEARFQELERRERIFGGDETIRNEKSEIVYSLNELSLHLCNVSFNSLCESTSIPNNVMLDINSKSDSFAETGQDVLGIPFILLLTILDDSQYQIIAIDTPAGEYQIKSHLPFGRQELKAILKVLNRKSISWSDLTEQQVIYLEALGLIKSKIIISDFRGEVGRRLYASLFPESLQPAIQFTLNKARTERKHVSIQLRFGEKDSDLARYPWELLHDGKRFLLPGGLVEITRYITYNEGSTAPGFNLPINMLYISCRPKDLELSNDNEEQNRVLSALYSMEKIKVKSIEHSTFDNFVKLVNRTNYQIFHFDGHGVFAKQCPYCKTMLFPKTKDCSKCGKSLDEVIAQTYVAFEDVDGFSDFVNTNSLENVLTGSEIRLAFISACQTSQIDQDTFNALGPALIRAGIPAVLAMQFEIEDSDAALFCEEFYASLGNNKSLSHSLRLARKLLYNRHSWFIPTFYLRVSLAQFQNQMN